MMMKTEHSTRTAITCTLQGHDADNVFCFYFDSAHELCRFLIKLGKGRLKRAQIARIITVE